MTSPAPGLRLTLLGGFDACLDGRSAEGFAYNKMRALLAYLAMEQGRDISRGTLAELLWSGHDPAIARGNLRRTLSDLRRVLELPSGKVLIHASKQSIRLDGADVDAVEFSAGQAPAPSDTTDDGKSLLARMERQAALYHGEFMMDFSLPDCPLFEDWIRQQREALHRRAIVLLEQIANCHEQAGDLVRALQFTLRRIELEPLDEQACRQAMRLYWLNGQHGAAIAQYEAYCRHLKKELNALPTEETQRFAAHIRNNELPPPAELRQQPSRPDAALPRLPAERRQVSVLYCELSPVKTADQDETMELLHLPQMRCMETIRQFSGHIVTTHGGSLLAYFGYPHAHEFSARRAVQAALAVMREAADGIAIRASVHTGLIITGGDSTMPDAVGMTSKLAIQLRQCVGYSEVAISRQTHDLVAGYFDCVGQGDWRAPDGGHTVEVFKVLKESGARTRLDTATQMTPWTGRTAEIAKLTELWQQAVHDARQVALIQGEAGIGKSRLLHAFKDTLAGTPHEIRELRCFPEFGMSPFHPIIALLETVFGFGHDDTHAEKFHKLAQYIETNYPADAQKYVPPLAHLLSLPASAPYLAAALPPQRQKELTIAVLLDLLQALAAKQPVLFILEDLHWIDPSTLELLTLFVEQTRVEPVLALLTARPEFDPPWDESFDTVVPLGPLSDEEAAGMVASINGGLADDIVCRIVAQADGIPLFVEEMAKMAATGGVPDIPSTLYDLLSARMDSMGEAKHTAQLAAAIGREFDLDLLGKIHPHDPKSLKYSLMALQEAGLVSKRSETSSQFRHALIQEVIYQSLVKADRQAVHRLIARTLQDDFHDIADNQPELLARHLSAGGDTRQAIEFWIRAGQRAVRNSANLEAAGHFNDGLKLLMSLPEDAEREKVEFTLLTNLCPVLYATRGYGSEDATRANARLAMLCERAAGNQELFLAKWAQVMNTIAGIGSRDVPSSALLLLSLAGDDPLKQQAAHYAVADAAFWLGDFETARGHTEQALALYRPGQHKMQVEQFGEDLSVSCAAYLAWSLYFLGFAGRAQQVCGQMLARARELDHPHTLALALCFASLINRWLGRRAEILASSAETMAISRQHDFQVWLAAGEMTHGWGLAMEGRHEDGIALLESSIARMRAAIGGISVIFLAALIEVYVHLRRYEDALALIARARIDEADTGDGHFSAELHRLSGVCLLGLSARNAKKAEACFNLALAVSRKQRAKSLELRAATDMAGLLQRQGRHEEARRLLEGVYGGFDDGGDCDDLRQAKAMLRNLPKPETARIVGAGLLVLLCHELCDVAPILLSFS